MQEGCYSPSCIPAYMYIIQVTPDPIHIGKFHCNEW